MSKFFLEHLQLAVCFRRLSSITGTCKIIDMYISYTGIVCFSRHLLGSLRHGLSQVTMFSVTYENREYVYLGKFDSLPAVFRGRGVGYYHF